MKKSILIFSLICFFCSCKNSKLSSPKGNYVELNDDLQDLVRKYIRYQPCRSCVYELYFDKIEPHYSQVIIYKGKNSLTTAEQQVIGNFSLLYTTIDDKKINIFTGAERYFTSSEKSIPEKDILGKSSKNFSVWVVVDRLNKRKIDTLEHVYPFLPLPVDREFAAPSPSSLR